jgi:hypothetical protein
MYPTLLKLLGRITACAGLAAVRTVNTVDVNTVDVDSMTAAARDAILFGIGILPWRAFRKC